jgi:hypothetical protein
MVVGADQFLAWFIGPDDDESCDWCEDAVNNNPYPIDEAPEPGDGECGSHCRHLLQLDDDAPDDLAPFSWSGSLGFVDGAVGAYDSELDTLLSQDTLTKDDVEKFLADNDLTMGDLENEIDTDDYQVIQDALDGGEADSLEDALASGDIDTASNVLKDADQIDDAIEMGKNGIADDVTAFALADVLSDVTGNDYVAKLTDGKWYVTTNLREGGAGSGNFGHEGRPGERGGSATGDKAAKLSGKPQAIFMIGGGGSGKGKAISTAYPDSFYHIDPDQVKQSEPMYSNKTGVGPNDEKAPGLYGPSGPRTWDEWHAYPQSVQDAQNAWIKANTPFSDAQDFAKTLVNDPSGNTFGGGITHELSSYMAKKSLDDAIADGTKSFIYDSTGSDKYIGKAAQARANGFDVTYHHVYMPEERAVYANSLRPRSVPEDLLRATHAKVRDVLPMLRDNAKDQGYKWRYTDNSAAKIEPKKW